MRQEELNESAIDYIIDNMEMIHLSQWEKEFYESISDRWHHRRSLSEKQKEVLGRIWDKQP